MGHVTPASGSVHTNRGSLNSTEGPVDSKQGEHQSSGVVIRVPEAIPKALK